MAEEKEDPIIDFMRRRGIAITRENWILYNWGKEIPDPWTAEHEMELPEELREKSE